MARLDVVVSGSSGSRGGISRLDWGGEKRKGKASLASVCLCNGA